MNRTAKILIGLALAGSAFTLIAQPCAGQGAGCGFRHGAEGFPPPVAATLDADTNGILSASEITQATVQLQALDRNRDGQLTTDELCPGGCGRGGKECPLGNEAAGRRACGKGQQPLFLRLFDADGDGLLSAVEINNSPAVLRGLDADRDGQLSPEELRPQAGCGQGKRWGQNRQGNARN